MTTTMAEEQGEIPQEEEIKSEEQVIEPQESEEPAVEAKEEESAGEDPSQTVDPSEATAEATEEIQEAPTVEDGEKAGEESGEGNEEEKPAENVDQAAEGPEGESKEGEDQADDSAEKPVVESSADGGEQVEGAQEGDQAEATEAVEGDEAKPTEPTEQTEEGGEVQEGEGEETVADKEETDETPPDGDGEGEESVQQEVAEGDSEEAGEGEDLGTKESEEEIERTEPERVESPVAVGEKLSRGGTPEVDGAALDQERLEATTPDKLGEDLGDALDADQVLREEDEAEEEEEEEEEDMVEPQFNRDELIERYHEALSEREQLQVQNYSLQHKLADYFRKKKADERQDYDKNVTDQEQRYLKYMAQLEDLRRQDSLEKENYRAQIEDAKNRCQDKKEKVDVERRKFMDFKKQVALNAINSRSGKPIPPKDIEQYMANEIKKEHEVVNVRLENIKLKNKLKKKEQQLKSKEELAEGLHLIDFEQLKIENQTYNEKIEERNEELLKLRKKITSTVQVLTHLKEKLQFVQGENLEQNNQLKEVEASLAQSRDVLSRTKQARDALRIDNQKLRQNCGLLGNEPLLRDFEERKDEGDELRTKLEQLRMKHAELTLHCNQVRRKIDQARQTTT